MSANEPIGYAVVGLGWISQVAVLPAFANARSTSRLSALVSGNEDKRRRLARRYDLPDSATYDYADYEACLERDDVDAVYIAVPNHLHRDYTVRAADRGVHVLVEKPMAVTVEEATAMIDACRRNDIRLMVAYRLHLDPATLYAIERVEAGAIGATRIFSSTLSQQIAEDDVRVVSPDRGGGPLYDLGIYCINAARYLFRAEPEAVWATRVARAEARFEQVAEAITCVLRFPDQRLASFTCSFGAHAVAVLDLVGDDGALHMRNAYPFRGDRSIRITTNRGGEDRTFPATDQFGAQLQYFSGCVLRGLEPEPDGEEGLVDVAIIRAFYESLERGEAVAVDIQRDRRPTPDMAIECPAFEEPELIEVDDPSA